jgi:adenine-specific DNA-methyltransferase
MVGNQLNIENRRFLGSKVRLLPFIRKVVDENCGDYKSFCDIFAGTGVVANEFNRKNVTIFANDMLKSSHVCLYTFLKIRKFDTAKLEKIINIFNHLVSNGENYFSKNFGGKYFSKSNARLIGRIRERIQNIKITDDERKILLTSLIYAIDKVANTVGHYDAYRHVRPHDTRLLLKLPKIEFERNIGNRVYNEDANQLVRKIKVDVLYIDPPYNSRQYGNNYHILENLVTWEKPRLFGTTNKMKLDHLRSNYCLKVAPEVFSDLIQHARCKHIIVSYNDTEQRKHSRSNARISKKQIEQILNRKGTLRIYSYKYQEFTTGKRPAINQNEYLYYCKVKK